MQPNLFSLILHDLREWEIHLNNLNNLDYLRFIAGATKDLTTHSVQVEQAYQTQDLHQWDCYIGRITKSKSSIVMLNSLTPRWIVELSSILAKLDSYVNPYLLNTTTLLSTALFSIISGDTLTGG